MFSSLLCFLSQNYSISVFATGPQPHKEAFFPLQSTAEEVLRACNPNRNQEYNYKTHISEALIPLSIFLGHHHNC